VKAFLTFISFLCLFPTCYKTQIPDSLNSDLVKNNRYFRYIYENDFFTQTDRYYTQGINPQLIAPFIRKSPLSKILIRLSKKSQNYYGFALEQKCFTPKSIRMDTLNRLERPYSGTLLMSHFLTSIDPEKKQRLTTKFDIGAIGQCAKCEEEQKAIHKALVNIQPLGWENQINNDIILNYSGSFEQGLFLREYFELIGFADARFGTLYDDVGGGFYIRIGMMNSYFKNFGIIKNAASNKFQLYFNARGTAKLVGYNGTLQGGLFENCIYTIEPARITRGVYSVFGGLVLAYKRISFEYANYYLTKEFLEGINHAWGRCTVLVCF
jgi:lipid A 3-O-deacylase